MKLAFNSLSLFIATAAAIITSNIGGTFAAHDEYQKAMDEAPDARELAKVDICHRTESGGAPGQDFDERYITINIAEQAKAAHIGQGGRFGACDSGTVCPELCDHQGCTDDYAVTDKRECLCLSTPVYLCGPNTECNNEDCVCLPGYEGDPTSDVGCSDIDECAGDPCGPNSKCEAIAPPDTGDPICTCLDGFAGVPPGIPCEVCVDTDVIILTDDFGGETSWELELVDTGVVASGSQSSLPSSTQNTVFSGCLDLGVDCYEFTIFDSFGDGICCLFGSGEWWIDFENTDADKDCSGGEFASQQSVTFGNCAGGSTCPPPARRLRRLQEQVAMKPTLQYNTVALEDGSTVEVTVDVVSGEQHVKIEIVSIDTGALESELFKGWILPGSPVAVTYEVGDIKVPSYSLVITNLETGDKKETVLAKVE